MQTLRKVGITSITFVDKGAPAHLDAPPPPPVPVVEPVVTPESKQLEVKNPEPSKE